MDVFNTNDPIYLFICLLVTTKATHTYKPTLFVRLKQKLLTFWNFPISNLLFQLFDLLLKNQSAIYKLYKLIL